MDPKAPKKEEAASVSHKGAAGPAPQGEQAAPLRPGLKKRPTESDREYFERTAGKRPGGARAGHKMPRGLILEEAGLINEDMLRSLQSESATSLKRALVHQGYVREDDILDALAREMDMEKADLASLTVNEDLLAQIPAKVAKEYRVFPVRYDETTLWVALSDPLDIRVTDDLERILERRIVGMVASEDEIAKFIKRYYEGNEVAEIYQQMTDDMHDAEAAQHEMYTTIDIADDDVEQPPVVKFVDLIFKQAVHDRASDIHIEPNRFGVAVRFRVDGVLYEVPSPPKKWQNAIISRLKVLSGMDLAEKRVPQDGRIKLNLPDRKLDLRVSSLPAIYGESVVMRILDQSTVLLGLEDVGFLEENIHLFNQLIRSPNGIILMTGPTGSGKTTTLYAALSTLNNVETKIVTVEDPVEYMIDGINQVQVNREVGLDFSRVLRSVLRQSPDVILVGEMRDQETAEIAVRAALTGHLVFSTLHTNDAPSSCVRLIDMGIKPFLVASSIQAIVAQRLVRKICQHCKYEYEPKDEEIREFGFEDRAQAEVTVLYKGKGCDRCNSAGYRGRTAIHEVFVMNPKLRQMVIRAESGSRLKRQAVRDGMRTLRMDGWQKCKRGTTTTEETLRMTQGDEG